MGAVVNGLVLSGLRAYGGTFFNFLDYMKPAVRLSALMNIPSIWVYTHDSVGLGEDGPTHQPIEQLATLRATPNMHRLPPCRRQRDGRRLADRAGAAQLRPPWPDPPGAAGARPCQRYPVADASRGGYVLEGDDGSRRCILIATGSEVHVALGARELLTRARRPQPGRVAAVVGAVRGAAPSPTATEVLPPDDRGPRLRRGGASPVAGSATPG